MLIEKGDRDDSPPRAAPKKKKKLIDTSMLSEVRGSIRESIKDKRTADKTKRQNRPERRFEIRSPLLDARAKKGEEFSMSTLHPFWAVLRCVGPKTLNNMELVLEPLVVPHLDLPGTKKGSLETGVVIPMLRNVSAIEKGDILTLPWKVHEDDEQ